MDPRGASVCRTSGLAHERGTLWKRGASRANSMLAFSENLLSLQATLAEMLAWQETTLKKGIRRRAASHGQKRCPLKSEQPSQGRVPRRDGTRQCREPATTEILKS